MLVCPWSHHADRKLYISHGQADMTTQIVNSGRGHFVIPQELQLVILWAYDKSKLSAYDKRTVSIYKSNLSACDKCNVSSKSARCQSTTSAAFQSTTCATCQPTTSAICQLQVALCRLSSQHRHVTLATHLWHVHNSRFSRPVSCPCQSQLGPGGKMAQGGVDEASAEYRSHVHSTQGDCILQTEPVLVSETATAAIIWLLAKSVLLLTACWTQSHYLVFVLVSVKNNHKLTQTQRKKLVCQLVLWAQSTTEDYIRAKNKLQFTS